MNTLKICMICLGTVFLPGVFCRWVILPVCLMSLWLQLLYSICNTCSSQEFLPKSLSNSAVTTQDSRTVQGDGRKSLCVCGWCEVACAVNKLSNGSQVMHIGASSHFPQMATFQILTPRMVWLYVCHSLNLSVCKVWSLSAILLCYIHCISLQSKPSSKEIAWDATHLTHFSVYVIGISVVS